MSAGLSVEFAVIREYFKSKASLLAFALTWDDKYV
jgi:hypothetical protein